MTFLLTVSPNQMKTKSRRNERGNKSSDKYQDHSFEDLQRSFRPRIHTDEKHQATCSKCGKECTVPFKPIQGRPVFCTTCFAAEKPRR
ncbi:MAG: CxxC-x17-CxxC domain-containing protein [Nanoarchaeota archaeon]